MVISRSGSSDGPCMLPSELWRHIIFYATSANSVCSSSREYAVSPLPPDSNHSSPSTTPALSLPCLKSDTPATPILYHNNLKDASRSSPAAAFSQLRTKHSIALTCRTLHNIVSEFLFDTLPLINVAAAEKLADVLENSVVYDNPGRWVRHITLVGVFFAPPSCSRNFAEATLRILAKTKHLLSFHLVWNSMTKELREHEEDIIAAIPPGALRHFEWQSTGAGFERQPQHKFFTLLRQASKTLRVLKIGGYLPLAEEVYPSAATLADRPGDGEQTQVALKPLEPVVLPNLTHLKVRRAFRDDLKLISPWNMSFSLTCLTLGSVWTYFDNREVSDAFWAHPKPTLRCLHLGEGTALCVAMARKILTQCPNLRELEYYYLGDWDERTWVGVHHQNLESVLLHISHPMIALRSFFNSRRFTREQQWNKLVRHISPFLGMALVEDEQVAQPGANNGGEGAGVNVGVGPEQGVAEAVEALRRTSLGDAKSEYPVMKKLTLIEYSRKFEELQYDPPELAGWLEKETQAMQRETEVELAVEVAAYIR